MAPSHGNMPKQFVSSYSFERVASLGRMILCLPPGLHSWYAATTVWVLWAAGCTMLYTCLPLVSHLSPTCDETECKSIKNYQNLYETPRSRRCDATSSHLIRLKPSGSSSEAIQQQFGSSQQQQLSNSWQLSSS